MDGKRLVVLAMAGTVIMLGAAIPNAASERQRAQAAAEETLELMSIEIDRSGMLFADKWEITEKFARLDTDQYSHGHSWSIPETIPPNGANATIATTATDKSGGTVNAKTTIFGYINVNGDQTAFEQSVTADKTNGPATANATNQVLLSPRGGGPPFVTVRVQDGPDVRFNYRIVTDKDEPPPITRRSVPPTVDTPTSYAAPKPLEATALPFPDFGADVVEAVVKLDLTRRGGKKIDDPAFIAAVEPSDENVDTALTLCFVIALTIEDGPGDAIDTDSGRAFARCVSVVARILQRAEENPNRRAADAAAGCRAVTVRKRGTNARPPLNVSCRRTATGMRIKIKPRKEGRSLRAAAGPAPKLVVGRSSQTAKKRGDRATVLWQTKG